MAYFLKIILHVLGALTLMIASSSAEATLTCGTIFGSSKAVAKDIYFLMPLKVKQGHLDDATSLVSTFKEAGVKNVWLGPVHPQTASEYGIHGKNDHGYWPSNHAEVSSQMGGRSAFKRFVQEAKSQDIGVWMDAVLGHFGYGEKVKVNGQEISLADSEYFYTSEYGSPLINPRMTEISSLMDKESNASSLVSLQKEISEYPIYHLPKIRQSHPVMAKYLIDSYSRFIEDGVSGFRIDAAKHIDIDFLKKFIFELQELGFKKNGDAPDFLLEMTFASSDTLSQIIGYLKKGTKEPDSIYAIDFPMAYELRRLEDPHYQLDWLVGFLNYRWKQKQNIKNLIPFIENHDFEGPLRDSFTAQSAYLLADFFSGQSPIVSHGLESTYRVELNNRSHIEAVNPHAELLHMRSQLSKALGNSRRNAEARDFNIISASKDFLLAERFVSANRKVLIAVNKAETSHDLNLDLKSFRQAKLIYSNQDINKVKINSQIPGKSLVVLEVEN